MTKLMAAIAYFEDAIRQTDAHIGDCSTALAGDCSTALAAELTEQKEHFLLALEALRKEDRNG